MAWPPRDSSSRPPIYQPSGLTSSEAPLLEQQQSRDRPRLPPLSTLLASSHSATSASASYPSHGSSSATARSPLGSHKMVSPSHSSPNLDRERTFYPLRHAPPPPSPSYPHPHTHRSSSATSIPVNLPPLTSLSIRSRGSRSPPPFATSLPMGADTGFPPRLPSTMYSSSSAARRRPSQSGHSDSYVNAPSTAAASSIGPIRRRVTSAVPMSAPYQRQSPVYEQDYFAGVSATVYSTYSGIINADPLFLLLLQVWDIYTYACRVNDDAESRGPQSYPSIANGDVQGLLYHLHGELDRLERRNPRLSFQLAQDAGLTSKRQTSTTSSSSSSSYQQRAGAHSTSRLADVRSEYHHYDDKRTPSDDMEVSSSQGSFTSPNTTVYAASGMPAAYSHSDGSSAHRRRLSAGAASSSAIGRSPQQSYASPPSHHYHRSGPAIASSQHVSPSAAALTSATNSTPLPPKRVRKRKDETDQSCLCCSATETPEWRKGPTGPRTLCNACGLLFAKQCRKKEMEAQGRGERPRGSRPQGPEIMTTEERQRSLAELRVAVNARTNASPPI